VVEDVSLAVAPGEILAIVGSSGSGKTTLALAIPRLLPAGAVVSGDIILAGQSLGGLSERSLRRFCGARVGMVFQDPLAALNPAISVGGQIAEGIRLHLGASRRAASARAVELLDEVGIEDARARAADYPHMFSGGMRQRAMIAAALACGPDLLIADEPTSGLDADRRDQILALLVRLRADRGLAVLLISHDVSLMARHADRAAVFYAGRCVEIGAAAEVLRAPLHRYTVALLRASPRVGGGVPAAIPGNMPEPESATAGCRFAPRCAHAQAACLAVMPGLGGSDVHAAACLFPATGEVFAQSAATPAKRPDGAELLRVTGLSVWYRKGWPGVGRSAVRDVSFSIATGECLGVVGASGSGKTSLARAVLQQVAYQGQVSLEGCDLASLRGRSRRAVLRRMQLVFQAPAASLDPVQTVEAAIGEALVLGGWRDARARRDRVAALLGQVGLADSLMDRLPATLSGGQAQRVAIARALAAEPALLVLDEPTASLDVSTAAGLLALLHDLAARHGLGYVLITHDLAVASVLAHRVAVMRDGRFVELGDAAQILGDHTKTEGE
jgi:oligopeptide/dipeptide ABC transporter ATP-binding protein